MEKNVDNEHIVGKEVTSRTRKLLKVIITPGRMINFTNVLWLREKVMH